MSLKQGFNDFLLSVGITPIRTRVGVSAYLDLVRQPQAGSTFYITGILTPELESTLFPPPPGPGVGSWNEFFFGLPTR